MTEEQRRAEQHQHSAGYDTAARGVVGTLETAVGQYPGYPKRHSELEKLGRQQHDGPELQAASGAVDVDTHGQHQYHQSDGPEHKYRDEIVDAAEVDALDDKHDQETDAEKHGMAYYGVVYAPHLHLLAGGAEELYYRDDHQADI